MKITTFTEFNKHKAIFSEIPVNPQNMVAINEFLYSVISAIKYNGGFFGNQIAEEAKKSVVRLCQPRVRIEDGVEITDALGFYRFSNGGNIYPLYEVPFIGLIKEKIDETADEIFASNNIDGSDKCNLRTPNGSLKLTKDEIRIFLFAKVFLHELAHAWLDVNNINASANTNDNISYMEEPMANCITLALVNIYHKSTDTNNLSEDTNIGQKFYEFVAYFIKNKQDARYAYGLDIYDALFLSSGNNISVLDMCANWRVAKGLNSKEILEVYDYSDLEKGNFFTNSSLAGNLSERLWVYNHNFKQMINIWCEGHGDLLLPPDFEERVKNALACQEVWRRVSKNPIDCCYLDLKASKELHF